MEVLIGLPEIFSLCLQYVLLPEFLHHPTLSPVTASHFALAKSLQTDRQTECQSPSLCLGWSFSSFLRPVDTCGLLEVQGKPRLLQEAFHRLLDAGSVSLTQISALFHAFPFPWLLLCLSPLPHMSSPRNSDSSQFVFVSPECSIILAWREFSGGVCRKRVKGKWI